jgi:hypothetical protein
LLMSNNLLPGYPGLSFLSTPPNRSQFRPFILITLSIYQHSALHSSLRFSSVPSHGFIYLLYMFTNLYDPPTTGNSESIFSFVTYSSIVFLYNVKELTSTVWLRDWE